MAQSLLSGLSNSYRIWEWGRAWVWARIRDSEISPLISKPMPEDEGDEVGTGKEQSLGS